MARGEGGGRLFEGGDYFKHFGQRGAINRGTAIIQGNTVFKLWPADLVFFFFLFFFQGMLHQYFNYQGHHFESTVRYCK